MTEAKTLSEADAYACAIGLLARREHSARELEHKLAVRGADARSIASVLERLIDQGLQSDERFAEAYLYQRSGKGYGPLRITAELRERGIDESLDSILRRQAEESVALDWFERVTTVYARKFGAQPIGDMKERARRMRFLQYRGFSHEQIAAVIDDD